MWIFEALGEAMDWAMNIREPIPSGLAQIGLLILILLIGGWFAWGLAISPLIGGAFMWKLRTLIIGIWLVIELAYKIGK